MIVAILKGMFAAVLILAFLIGFGVIVLYGILLFKGIVNAIKNQRKRWRK